VAPTGRDLFFSAQLRSEMIGPPARTIYHHGASQVVLAIRVGTLLTKAEKSNGVIELVPQVGDFVAVDEPLFNLYGGAAAIDERDLRNASSESSLLPHRPARVRRAATM